MEKELNIAAILMNKPNKKKIWSKVYGMYITLCNISDEFIECKNGDIRLSFYHNGKSSCYPYAIVSIAPSYEMQDWSKFAWKKGDVLQISHIGFCTFEEWTSNDYTTFKGRYGVGLGKNNDHDYDVKEDLTTSMWYKVDNKDFIKEYLSTVEKRFGGKLNLSTLETEKPQFKDGDIIKHGKNIYIVQNFTDSYIRIYAGLVGNTGKVITRRLGISSNFGCSNLATDSEKQQLFAALEKENKAWDVDKRAIVDLPKKYKFKTMDYFLARYNYSKDALWNLYQYAFTDKDGYIFVVNESCIESDKYTCIPYNEETAHLLGTTDDWKGGEE